MSKEHTRSFLVKHFPHFLSELRMQDLMKGSVIFHRLMSDYGSTGKDSSNDLTHPGQLGEGAIGTQDKNAISTPLMQEEERAVGAVPLSTYKRFLDHAGTAAWLIPLFVLLTLAQGAQGIHAGPPLLFPLMFFDSGREPDPRLLDFAQYSRVPARPLYGSLRRSR